MFQSLKRLAVPPVFDDQTQTYTAQLLHWCLIVLTGTELLAILFLIVTRLGLTLTLPAFLALNLVTLLLLHRRQLEIASLIFITLMWLILTVTSLTNRGVLSPGVSGYVLIIMLATILLRERGAIIVTAVSILAVILMALVGRLGLVQFPYTSPNPPETMLIAHVIIFATGGTLLYFTVRRIRIALAQLLESEAQLAERNQALEREAAERRQAEAERDRLFELSQDMMTIADLDGYFKRLNPAFERTLGYTTEEMLAQPFLDLIHPDDVESTRQELENLASGNYQPVFENRYRRKDGQYRWFAWTTTPVGNTLYAVARDVTERKAAETQERELALAREKNRFLAEFLSTVTHDLKTPLSVINTNLYLLERIHDPDRQHDKIQQIKEQTALVEKFIQDILTVTRLDHLPHPNRKPVDLNALLEDVTRQLRSKSETKTIAVNFDLAHSLPNIAADHDQLQSAFSNLVDNALNYTPTGGKINIRTAVESDKLIVEIADTGVGIRTQDIPHIFERFFRSDEARALQSAGTGLGLAIVKKVIDIHGWELQVSSAVGQGTIFQTFIPLSTAAG